MKKRILFLSALALFLSSCEIFSSLSEKTGAISIKMPEGSERIAETYDVNEITSFTAELYDSGSSPVAKVSSAPGKSITFENLTPGSYAIIIKAFKSAECAAYAEKSGIVVEAGATTYETITLFKNIIKNIESIEIAKESLDKITKNYTVGQTFALPDNVSIIAHFIHGYEEELEPNDYEIYICNAEKYTEETLVKNQPLSENSRFAVIGICTESGYKYSAPVSLVMNAEEPVVTWTNPTVKDNTISFTISASASGEISYIWEKAKTADMAGKTACTSEINMAKDGTVELPLQDESGAYVYYVCTVTNTNSAVNGTTTASRQTAVFSSQMENFTVTFNLNYDGSTNTTQDVASGSAVEKLEPPTRDGYIFGGWYTDTDCTNEYDFAIGVTADITLYAKWTAEVITYTVTFNLNYDGSTDTTQSVTSGNAVSTPEVPTRDGYVFAGWYTDTGCTGEYDFSGVVTKNITLYAKWVEVITDWTTLYAKLNDKSEDFGNIYVSGEFDVTDTIIFYGTARIIPIGSVTFTRSGSFTDDFFFLNPDSMTFKGSETAPIVFDGTYTTETSNLITNWGTTTFEYCSFQNNSSSLYASVYLMDGYNTSNTTFRFCSFTGNKGLDGGAVYVGEEDKVYFENCRFENNTSSTEGGAVFIAASATATFSDCIFGSAEYEKLGNSCTGTGGAGGAVYATGATNATGASITLSNCEFYYNKATGDYGNGGAIGADSSSTVTITEGCTFKNNATALLESSLTHGGALYIHKSSLVLPNSGNIFVNNREGNKTEYILSDIYIVPGTINDSDSYTQGSYTVAEDGRLTPTPTSTSQ